MLQEPERKDGCLKGNDLEMEGSLMLCQCCVCRKMLDSKPGPLNEISHGLCTECYESQMKELQDGE